MEAREREQTTRLEWLLDERTAHQAHHQFCDCGCPMLAELDKAIWALQELEG